MPFSHNGLKTTTGMYRYTAVKRFTGENTLCHTDFKMEISTGVSLLRTAQSLLTGRTISIIITNDIRRLIVHLTLLYVLYINIDMSSTMKFFLFLCTLEMF